MSVFMAHGTKGNDSCILGCLPILVIPLMTIFVLALACGGLGR